MYQINRSNIYDFRNQNIQAAKRLFYLLIEKLQTT